MSAPKLNSGNTQIQRTAPTKMSETPRFQSKGSLSNPSRGIEAKISFTKKK